MASNDNARGRAAEALEAARERTSSAYEAARSRATAVTREASAQLAVYPVAAVLGGFALGALAATLLPGTDREEKLLGKTGRRLTGAAREAAQKGFDTGREQIDEIRSRAAQRVGEAVGEAVVDAVAGKP
jgi:ElaB/YqjD/DUF883 family membrane-anchored ribosome-binding protein